MHLQVGKRGWLLAACLLVGASRGLPAEPVCVGPLYSDFGLTLESGDRTEVLGPLYASEQRKEEYSVTLSPVVSWEEDPDLDTCSLDVVYPLMTYHRYGRERRLQFLQMFSLSGGVNQQGVDTERFTLFPFYFQQRSPDPQREYTAFFPFYGRLQNRLFRDEVRFVAWPAYVRTRKRDVVTVNYLAPFVHVRHGDGLEGWQVWPFVGSEHKTITTRTNNFGDAEVVPGHDKNFVLWPFYFHGRSGIGSTNPVNQNLFFPFYMSQRSPARDSSTYLLPLGLTLTDDRERQYREFGAPWPLVVFARGEGKDTSRVWPFFGHAQNKSLHNDFFLWPIYKRERAKSEAAERDRQRVLLFLYSDLTEKELASGKARCRTDLWPLFTVRQDLNGSQRLQVLAPLEPFLPNNNAVERLYSPLWSVWRAERNPAAGTASQSFLWNLYRHETTRDSKRWSFLLGLFQYRAGPDGKQLRLFYIPLGKSGASPSKTRAASK